MKSKHFVPIASLLPFLIALAFAAIGITLNVWVYVVLAVVCPLAAGIVWWIHRDSERKVSDAEREGK